MIELSRWYHNDCTLGRLKLGSFQCFTLELPWLDNQNDISCIHEGVYKYKLHNSPSKGMVLEIQDVEGRTYIQIHAGNYTHQILGCILVGSGIKWLDSDGVPDVTNSVNTLRKLLNLAGSNGYIKIA